MNGENAPAWTLETSIEYTKVQFGSTFSQLVLDPDISHSFDKKLGELWHNEKTGFPGSLAASVLRSNLPELKANKYHILPKSDGTRYILHAFKNTNGSNIIDMFCRTGSHYIVGISMVAKAVFSGTIFDGELVLSRSGEYQFHVFDCIASCGKLIDKEPYTKRMAEATRVIEKLYKYSPQDSFKIMVKKPCDKDQARIIMTIDKNDVHYPLDYPIDGLILVAETRPYLCGKDEKLFKYKKVEDHTVDFFVRTRESPTKQTMCDLHIIDNGKHAKKYTIQLAPEDLTKLNVGSYKLLDNSIVECNGFIENRSVCWRPLKIRLNKQIPNNQDTLDKTIQNIIEDITLKELCSMFI